VTQEGETNMARRYYPGIVHREGDAFGIHFPDLPGCTSAADSLDECLANAEEAVTLYVEDLLDEGKPLPEASAVRAVIDRALNDEDRGTVETVQLVPATLPTKAIRLTISMDEELIKRIDAAAGHYGRSGWLADAARIKLAAR